MWKSLKICWKIIYKGYPKPFKSVLLAKEGINEVDGAPVVEMVASSVQMAISLANLKNHLGITYSKNGQYRIKPEEKRKIISMLSA